MTTPDQDRPRPRKPVPAGRDLWWHVLETCAIVTGTVLAAAWLVPASVPLWELSGPMAVVSGVIWLVTVRHTGSLGLAGWLLSWGVFLTSWFVTARIIGVWTSEQVTALVVGFFILAPFGPSVIGGYRAMSKLDAAVRERERGEAEKRRWEDMFRRLGVRNMHIRFVYRHPTGLQIEGQLGSATDKDGVVTFDRIKALAADIAVDRKLPEDAVYFEKGATADLFTLHLRTLKGKRPVEHLPDVREPATVNKPIAVGRRDNGKIYEALFREVAVMIVGVRNSGKSNLMNVIIAQMARCPDALIFVIDLKGGRMARPWLIPWLLGETPRPVVDWLATTREEALIMLDALIAGGNARAESGEGGEKITPSRAHPAVFLFVDETALMTGHGIKADDIRNSEIAKKLAIIAETYRSEAVDPVVSALRSNVDIMGSTALKAQSTLRFGLRVNEPQDASSVFPNDEAAAKALSKITEEGAGMVRVGSKISPPVKYFRITLERCVQIARFTGPWRPEPDQVLLDAFGEAYRTRWDRMEDRLTKWRVAAEKGRITDDEPVGRTAVALLDRPPQDRDPALDRDGGGPGRLLPGPGDDQDGDQDDVDVLFREIASELSDVAGAERNPARAAMREILIRTGEAGITSGELLKVMAGQGHRINKSTLLEWLGREAELGRVIRHGRNRNDPYARWIWVRQVNGPPRRDEEDDW